MGSQKTVVMIAVAAVFVWSFMLTGKAKPTKANGKALFTSTVIGGNGKTCDTCHPGGEGLESAGVKTEWKANEQTFDSMAGVINACVRDGLEGRSLRESSLETQSLALYLGDFKKSLVSAPAPAPAPAAEEDDEDKFGC